MTHNCPGCGQPLKTYPSPQGEIIGECCNKSCPRIKITREVSILLALSDKEIQSYHNGQEASRAISDAAVEAIAADDRARRERWLAMGRSIDDYNRMFGSALSD